MRLLCEELPTETSLKGTNTIFNTSQLKLIKEKSYCNENENFYLLVTPHWFGDGKITVQSQSSTKQKSSARGKKNSVVVFHCALAHENNKTALVSAMLKAMSNGTLENNILMLRL